MFKHLLQQGEQERRQRYGVTQAPFWTFRSRWTSSGDVTKAAGHSSLSLERCAGDSLVVLKSLGLDRVRQEGAQWHTSFGGPASEDNPGDWGGAAREEDIKKEVCSWGAKRRGALRRKWLEHISDTEFLLIALSLSLTSFL